MSNLVVCRCQTCNQPLEFEAIHNGQTVSCPHCGIDTVLYVPKNEPAPIVTPDPPKNKIRSSHSVDWGGIGVGFLAILFGIWGGMEHHASVYEGHHGSFLIGFFLGLLLYVIFLFLLFIYCLPAVIAAMKKKKNTAAIVLLNLFLGWTFIGWVVCLIWAAIED